MRSQLDWLTGFGYAYWCRGTGDRDWKISRAPTMSFTGTFNSIWLVDNITEKYGTLLDLGTLTIRPTATWSGSKWGKSWYLQVREMCENILTLQTQLFSHVKLQESFVRLVPSSPLPTHPVFDLFFLCVRDPANWRMSDRMSPGSQKNW